MRWTNVNLPGNSNSSIPAFYLHGRYMLTDDVIPYNRSGGVFGRVTPKSPFSLAKGQWGAWEATAQVSHIDLNDLASQPQVPGPGRRMTNFSTGLNWYLQTNAKMHFEFINSQLNDRVQGNSDTNVYAAMIQFDF
jgi:phosphate-selective porin OprO/OprP